MQPQSIPQELKDRPQWVCHDEQKRPINPHTGLPASVTDPTTWGTFEQVEAIVTEGRVVGGGFVLTEHDPYTFIDLDVNPGEEPTEEQLGVYKTFASYSERSPSGRGLHIIVKGSIPSGRRRGKIEVYSSGRYMTMTGNVDRNLPILDFNEDANRLWSYLGGSQVDEASSTPINDPNPAAPITDERHVELICGSPTNAAHYNGTSGANPSEATFALICAAALFSSDEAQVRRVVMASPLVQSGPHAASGETRAHKVQRLWGTEYPRAARRGAQERQQQAQAAAHGAQVVARMGQLASGQGADAQTQFDMNFVTGDERPVQMEHLIDPWLPKRTPVGFYGRGESGKSTFAASLCASASSQVSTFWISSEEDLTHVAVRHTHSGGEPNTLITLPANPTKYDKQTGNVTATTFDVYSHLDAAIRDFPNVPGYRPDRPLGIVVLDAINALVTWGKGENANDDASVKRLLGHILTLALNHNLTIIIIGHVNKNTNKEHGADAVTGSAAWTNSLRRAFMFYKDVASDDYEGFVRSAKGNTGTPFASSYKTVPVYTLLKRQNGMDEVLCRVELTSEIVWGERNIAKLLNDSDDEDPTRDKRVKRESRVTLYAIHVAKAIRDGATTRDAISATLPKEVGPIYAKYWAKVDRLLQDRHGITVATTVHGRYEYAVAAQPNPRSYTQTGGSLWNG